MAKTLSLAEMKTRLPELVAGVREREEEVAVTTRRNPRPADGGDSGSIGGDARADFFDNDLSDLPGKTFGDFHILQNMARF